ncbi:hypothetical protein ULMS_07930 [Patiriisocius marinistellae]|uniref:Membrane or secreted protein n=1 Tax=Patiriisocius marinistellae TaxID=2494560 RepID=A0A5J4FZ39_9FLAO|nr:hypothetical protein [Patiriisocius marinistellae]GEQ85285.1 hypothetical protein ULMS_07930 [Patiriisocius marinistellae]
METTSKFKKYLVLGVLFLLPISIYVFFGTGVDNFGRLPVLVKNVNEVSAFKDINGDAVQLNERITVLGFFGTDALESKAYTYNLAHKIYSKYQGFEDFQFLILLPESARNKAKILTANLETITNTKNWKFAFGAEEEIDTVFKSLNSGYSLDSNSATPYVFIIDKEMNLRGRNDDEKAKDGMVYGYNSADVADINNRMTEDVKVVFAEYRLALKRNNKYKREI